ncbi:MAG: NUDIX domain-containing protein [archaeon]
MKEILKIYDLQGECIGSIEKAEAHKRMRDEFFEKGATSIRHRHARVLLMTSKGHLILQRRSKWKGDNAGLWDKTIGGHVTEDDSYALTVLKECAEELGIPATIVDEKEFLHTAQVTNLHVLGVLTKVAELDNYQSFRLIKDGKKWIEPSITHFYFGYYDGAIQFIDEESCGIQTFMPEEIEEELKSHPELFTDDMTYIMEKLRPMLIPLTDKREPVKND